MRTFPRCFAQLATLKQIHSSTCVPAAGRSGMLGEGDALLEDRPGCVVAVKTADCIPILLADERLHAVAAVHAGWRGTVGGDRRARGGGDDASASARAPRTCTPPSDRASANAATRWARKWRRISEGREEGTSIWPAPTAASSKRPA